jgi:phage terminase large subunit-like protein
VTDTIDRNYCAVAGQYAADIMSGKLVACKWTRLAIERNEADLLRQETPEFQYHFDEESAHILCSFMELLPHVKGEKGGALLILEPWQCWLLTALAGWKRRDGKRRFRHFFLECGKSQGKSFISSGLALFFLCADGEPGAECVAAARTSDQSRLVFDAARDLLRARPDLCAAFGLKVLQHSIAQPSSASTFKPVSAQGRSLAGMILHYASVDELEFHRDDSVITEMTLGCAKRTNSLLTTIQHAGENLSSPGYAAHVTATKILDGELNDPLTLAVIYSAEGLDWKSDDAIRAANPNLNVSVYFDTLKAARDRAVAIPSQASAYKSHNLVLWEGSATAWVPVEVLASCRQKNLKMEDFRCWHVGEQAGVVQPNILRPFVIGSDLASRQDLAATVFCTKGFLDGVEHYYLFSRAYLPAEAVATSPVSVYKGWAARGLLCVHEGSSNDYAQIEADILALYRRHVGYGAVSNADGFLFKAAAYDSWQAATLSGNLEKSGIQTIPFPKNAKTYSPVMDWFMSLALAGRVHFSCEDEPMFVCLANISAKRDANSNLFPLKANNDPLRKIDVGIAALYALRLAMVPGMLSAPEPSTVPVIFIHDDGRVMRGGPDGLIQVHGPLPVRQQGAHPSDAQAMGRG